MAGPGGREVGRVSVRALPDTSSFARSLERYLERVERTLRVNIPVDLNDGDVAGAEVALDKLTRDRKVNVSVDVDRKMLDRFSGALSGIGGIGGSGGGGIGSALGGSGGLLKVGAIVAALAAALPVISTLVLALPALLTTILAPIAAILVGLDGIKKAAGVLAEPFEHLAKVVSGVFERQLTPVFKKLVKIFAPLEVGLSQIARGVVDMVDAIVDGLTSKKGLGLVRDIFTKIARAFHILAPSLTPLTEAFLQLIDAGAQAFVDLAPTLVSLTTTFASFVDSLAKTGLLEDSFKFLATAITIAIGAFYGFIAAGTLLAAFIQRWWGVIGRIFTDFPAAVASGINGAISLLVGFPGRAVSAIGNLPGRLSAVARSAMTLFLSGFIKGFGDLLAFLVGIPGLIGAQFASLPGVLAGIGIHAGEALISGIIAGIGHVVGDLVHKAEEVAQTIKDHFPGSPVKKGPLTSWNNGGAGKRLMQMLADGISSGEGLVNSALSSVAGGLAVPAVAGGSFLPSDFGSALAGGSSSRTAISITNWRDGTGYFETVADSRVNAAAAMAGETERAL